MPKITKATITTLETIKAATDARLNYFGGQLKEIEKRFGNPQNHHQHIVNAAKREYEQSKALGLVIDFHKKAK